MLRQLIGMALLILALPQTADVDAAFHAFWAAASPKEAAGRIDAITATRITFDDAYRRLKHGRTYTAEPAGVVRLSHRLGGVEHHFALNVPSTYDPSRRYQVRFQ